MSTKKQPSGEPPQPPEVKRRAQFHRMQLIGMPFIFLIPLLALTTLLGNAYYEVAVSGLQIELRADYPQRYRYRMPAIGEIYVKNISSEDVPTITVSINNSYIDAFTDLTFTPDVDEVDDKAHKVELQDVRAGETRMVTLEMRPDEYGVQSGEIVAEPEGGEPVRVRLDTFVFP